ncbi:MAG: DNA polymerase III subunit delta [Bacilli bacterium]
MIFAVESVDFDEKSEVLRALRKFAKTTIIPDLDQSRWFDYGKAYFKNNLATIDSDALRELIARVNGDLNSFINEANKLILYKNHINLIDVTLMVAKPLENNIYALTKALFRGDKASALDIFADLRTNNVEPVTLISMLANQFRLMSEIRYLDQRGLMQSAIAKELGLPDFRVKMSLSDSRRLSRAAILRNLDALYELDLNIKSGLVDRYYAFELFLLNFA